MRFTFSDTIAGYVISAYAADRKTFAMKTRDGREFEVTISPTAYAEMVRNMKEPYSDSTAAMGKMLTPGRFLFVYGTFYPEGSGAPKFDAKRIVFLGRTETDFFFEKPDWQVNQIRALAQYYRFWQFGEGPIDYRDYRTILSLSGGKKKDQFRQETDTISRLVYGFASAYLLTGEDDFLDAAEKGTEYLREHMRFVDLDEGIVYWYHGIDVEGKREQKIFASEFGDDYDAIPMYEQIYALVGPTQTYRVTGDPAILSDIQQTLKLFDKFFVDREKGGYFSHIDPITLDARAESLGRNRGTKNWNSVGDHAPAYLINLWLATGDKKHLDFLVETADCIEKYFPDYENSPFVNERFFEDWSPDHTWAWQQNRAVVGHNLKIAWNLTRIHHAVPDPRYTALARRIADLMPEAGSDLQRGGWYDVVERVKEQGQEFFRHVWHDRKAWWQQEQGILAYYILAGSLKGAEDLKLARESAAFYNAFFIDHDDGGVYFNTLANGLPYLMGNERLKGSHSMSNYHASELCYLSAVYINLLLGRSPLDMYFRPKPGGFADGLLRVAPDILPPGAVRISDCWIDDEKYTRYDAAGLTVSLPQTAHAPRVKVRLSPNT
ncbi:MAG TPA: AGE family epimerase/isomerase [Planctomycetota bacterium]|nr:AGE family epimerase/isomerase [Planctomycetota bacterium]